MTWAHPELAKTSGLAMLALKDLKVQLKIVRGISRVK
jgi:hypothetical protein